MAEITPQEIHSPGVPLRVRLLGNLEVEYRGRAVTAFESDKARGLMVYLLLHPRALRREHLAGLFWGARPESRARGNLSRVLTNLRRLMPGYLLSDRHTVQFDREQPFWLDVQTLEEGARQSQVDDEAGEERARAVVALYRGEFLEGFSLPDCPEFEEWVVVQRERLHRLALGLLDHLVERCLARGEYRTALGYARRSLHSEPWREAAHRQVMLLLARTGQRTAALRQYERCRTLLAEELGLAPSVETTALYHRIRAAADRPPSDLETQPNAFVGREPERMEIRQRLADPACRLLTLVGPGGVGKSRLAFEVAKECATTFLEGVAFVSLAALDSPEALPTAIARVLQLTFHQGKPARAQLLDYLQQRELLLVLDNFEHLLEATPLLTEILRHAPAVQILVTSRERLRLRWEWVFELRGLPVEGTCPESVEGACPESVEGPALTLFRRRALQAGRSLEENAEDVASAAEICVLLDGLPLGIELAAALTPYVACAEIAARLEADLAFLESPLRDVPARHRSLAALFEHSWRLLSPEEQRVLAALSVFRGEFDPSAAGEIAGASPAGLQALVEKSLLHRISSQRYRLHERTRQFAAEKGATLGLVGDDLRARHGRYYLSLVQKQDASLHGAEPARALERLDAALANVRAAWAWALQTDDMALLIQVIPPLNYYYEHRGWFEEGIDGFEEAVRVLRERDDLEGAARLVLGALLSALGNLYCFTEQHTLATVRSEESVALLEALPPTAPALAAELPVARGRARVYLALAYLNSHRYDEAVDTCQAGLHLLQGRAPSYEVGFALNALGNILYLGGEYEGAGNYYREAADCFQRSGDVQGYAIVLSNLGNIAFYQEDYDGAEALYRESLELKARLGDHWRAAVSRHNLGEVAYIRGDYAQARSYFAQSAAEARALSHRGVAMESLNRLADVARMEGEREGAQEYLYEALSISQSTDNLDARANIHLRLARLAWEGEALEEARYQLQRALNLRLLPPAQLNLLVEAAQLLSVQGDGARALTWVHFVARRPESGRVTRERAASLADRWGSRLPSSAVEEAAARSRTLTLEEVRLDVLRALAAGS